MSNYEAAGFEYVNTVAQPLSVIWSMHKKKNPLTVVSGELILNFRKIRNPKTLAIVSVGVDAFSLMKDSAELTIVTRDGATTDQICSDLIPKLLEHGLLGEVSSKIGDVTPLLTEAFDYDGGTQTWHVRAGRKLGCHIPLDQRIRFYTTDFLNQQARLDKRTTIDEIVMALLPKLKNGEQPRRQKVMAEIRKIAAPSEGKYWILQTIQHEFPFVMPKEAAGQSATMSLSKPEEHYDHNEMILILAKLGRAAGFDVHIGKKEQVASWGGEKLANLVNGSLQFMRAAETFTRRKIEQIDLIWLDGKIPVLAFEIEHSTAITTGLDRFIELLRVDHRMAERVIIVVPKARKRKIDSVLSGSHYIGTPMYMETKVRYLWYSDALKLANTLSARGSIAKKDALETLLPLLQRSDARRS